MTSPESRHCSVTVDWAQAHIQYPAVLDPSWSVGSTMVTARMHHSSAIVTANGRELGLVFGGYAFSSTIATAELFDETTNSWAQTGSLVADVAYVPAVTPNSATALAVGGFRVTGAGGVEYDGVQAYNAATGLWTLQGHLGSGREEHSATLLANGKVLVAGGFGPYPTVFATAVLYNPSTGTATAAGTMQSARGDHTATLLSTGKVLVVDGIDASGVPQGAADLYDPSTNGWSTAAAPPPPARFSHVASLLTSGKVLIAGGEELPAGIGQTLGTAIYDPTAGTWSAGPAAAGSHYTGTAIVLKQGANVGKVVLAGGDFAMNGVELFDPGTSTWKSISPLLTGRDSHVALGLQSGILFAGGSDSNGNLLSSAELYKPDVAATAPQWPAQPTLTVTAVTPTSAVLSWPAAADPNGVGSYVCYANGVVVATVSGSSLSCTATGLTPGSAVTFTVQAVDPSGAPTGNGPSTIVCPPSDVCHQVGSFSTGTNACIAGAPVNVDDGNPCTLDTCDPVNGIVHHACSTLDRTVSTVVPNAAAFLYSGTNPVQTGVGVGAIAPSTMAVIRGTARDATGAGLPGVTVTVVGHPELGSTITQGSGGFDMAVNGGQTLRLHYALANYLPVERLVQAPWQDYVAASDVALVQLDPRVTAIDMSSSSTPSQIARGTASSDSSGTRQATLFVPPGTLATMTLPDGSTTPLSTMHVRATEYSVGDTAYTALPADLPATNAYAYAVELTADEALAAHAKKLTFSQPLPLYIEDFLGLPVGTIVPSGYYDPSKGSWLASSNGIILQIVSVTGSAADVDVTGDGIADTGSTLAALGITDPERAQLASLYSVGQMLWRTPVGHFTGYHNGPDDGAPPGAPDASNPCIAGAAEDACGPNYCTDLNHCGASENTSFGCHSNLRSDCSYYCCPQGYALLDTSTCQTNDCDSPPPPPPSPDGPADCEKNNASTIACQRQSLGEDVAIAGTPYALHYESDRQRGRQAEVTIPLSAIVGGTPTSIEMRVSVAGRLFTQSFPGSNFQTTTFIWDGRDAYGRLLQGGQPIGVEIGYAYGGVYQNARTFGVPGSGTPIANSTTRKPFMIAKGWASTIDFWDAQPEGMGGWTLNVHHTYDVAGHVLRLGDGSTRSLRHVPPVIRTIAGNGQAGTNGDGTSATAASVTSPQAVAIGFDATIYISDSQSCVRRVGSDGVIHTFAGQCHNPGFSGDGPPAASAQLQNPQDIVLGPDGSVYIADTSNQRIRRVDPSGVIHTVAGSGPVGPTSGSFSGEGGQAVLATLNNPTGVDITSGGVVYVADRDNGRIREIAPDGTIVTVAGNGPSSASTGTGAAATAASLGTPARVRVGPDGSFYVAESTGNVVRRVGSEGIIHAVVGTGTAGYTRDGVAAMGAMINGPLDLAFGPGGDLYVVDQNNLVRQITPRGIITTVAGINGQGGFSGDNGLATAATMGTSHAVRVGPDGSVYVASTADNRVRRVQTVFGGFSATTNPFQFPSEDGRQLFVFDGSGRHQQTVDAWTGTALYSFAYDSGGRLASVTDVAGNVTQFTHDGAGHLVSVVTPYGQQTTVTSDANGYLASASDPASETTRFTYDVNGLMQTKTDPRGGLSQYTYDSEGRLTHDQDAAGGSTTLARTDTSDGSAVTMTSALGVQTTLATNLNLSGSFRRVNSLPIGAQSSFTRGATSSTVVQPGSSQVTTTTQGPDPRFGMLAPIPLTMTTTLASGLTSTQSTARSITTLSGGGLATFLENTNLNGNTWAHRFDAASRTWTSTSPVGRQTVTTLDALGHTTQITTPNVTPFAFTYDSRGRLSTMKQGTSRTWTMGYDPSGYLQTVTDPLSHTTTYQNDAVGRAVQTTLADGRLLGTAYDANGNATRVTLPAPVQNLHQLAYTPVDLLASYTPPTIATGSPSTQYAYDLDRNLSTMTRPDAVGVTFAYDPAGRLTSTTYPQGTLSRTYDETGQLATLTSPSAEVLTYAYDGSLRTGITWGGPVSGSLSLGYDSSFRVNSQSVNGNALMLGYDADSLLTQAGALTVSRDAQNGRITGTTLGSVTDTYSYDGNGFLSTYVAKYNGGAVYSESVLRDALGRITQKTDVIGTETHVWVYTYDVTGRLTDVTKDGSAVSHYGYDADDNRTTFTGPGGTIHPTYDVQDRLLTYGSATYAYTANGERTTKTVGAQVTGYTYDALGNLLHVGLPSATALDYVVDGENRRVGKKVNTTLTQGFLYQDALNVVAQLDGSGNVVAQYMFGSKPNVPDYFTSSAGTFRILSDHLGSPRLIIDISSGNVVERIDYDEFGNVTQDTSPGLTPFGFAGGLYDKDTGLVRFGARDYDASVGRWTSKDPIRFHGGQGNLYAYVGNDPVNLRDPDGRVLSDCDIVCNVESILICGAIGATEGPLGPAAGVACAIQQLLVCDAICHPAPPVGPAPAPAPPYSPPPPAPPICTNTP